MWSARYLGRIDFRLLPVLAGLMMASVLVIGSYSADSIDITEESIFTPLVKRQLKFFLLGGGVFLFFAGFDYNKLREWSWILYFVTLVALCGLFFSDAIARVHRWYRIPLIGFNFQPSELAKLSVVITLSWFLERKKATADSMATALQASLIVFIPFILILKQPDLGTALVLCPVTLVMFYFGDINRALVRIMAGTGAIFVLVVLAVFLGIIPHEELRPYAMKVMKEYQFDRMDPNTHHQRASTTAIAIGGMTGTGWRKSDFSSGGWLPEPYTDSVFATFGEQFGFVGLLFLMALFYLLIYFGFQVAAVAKDHFGRLLAAGVTVYLAMHIVVNIGMMVGCLPITGVPLVLVTYGGSSVVATMAAVGILQSIYSRRFMF